MIYLPFARQILKALSERELVLVMDSSQAGRGCMVIMVGVVYKKRALPIAWLVYKGKKGHATAKRHIEALEKVKVLLPEIAKVILLGDAEYDTSEMLLWVQENTQSSYVLCTSPQIYVITRLGEQAIGDIALERNQMVQYLNVGFTQSVTLGTNLVGWWSDKYEKPIYLISNLTSKYLTCRHYQRRYRIESSFSNQKSRGLNIHKCHLSDPARVSRLLVAACLAYIWMILQGLQVIAENKSGCIDRTERNDKSVFRLGLD